MTVQARHRRVEQIRGDRLVERDERDVLRDAMPALAQPAQQAGGERVGAADHRRRRLGERHQLARRDARVLLEARRLARAQVLRRQRQPGAPDGRAEGLQPLAARALQHVVGAGADRLRRAHVGDPPVAVRVDEVLDQQPHAAVVVHRHGARAALRRDVVEEDGGHADVLIAPGRRHQQPVHLMRAQRAQRLALARGRAPGVEHQHVVARRLERVLGALERAGVERRADVRHDEPDRHRRARAQRAREAVGLEAQPLRDLPHAPPRVLVDERALGQRARRRRLRDTGLGGHVGERRRGAAADGHRGSLHRLDKRLQGS